MPAMLRYASRCRRFCAIDAMPSCYADAMMFFLLARCYAADTLIYARKDAAPRRYVLLSYVCAARYANVFHAKIRTDAVMPFSL